MKPMIQSTEQLTGDPEAFENYFQLTEKDSRDYLFRVKRIQNMWRDWDVFSKKNRKKAR